MIINLWAEEMTACQIAEHLEATYGVSVSHETIANITDPIIEQVREWRYRTGYLRNFPAPTDLG
jgi:putative transposase